MARTIKASTETQWNFAQASLLGLFVGDALGAPGQITGGEKTIALLRSLALPGTDSLWYDPERTRTEYRHWLLSNPVDGGTITGQGLAGAADPHSEGSGALLRVAPLGLVGALTGQFATDIETFARKDAEITHPNPVCTTINAFFAALLQELVNFKVPDPVFRRHYAYAWSEGWALTRQEPWLLALIKESVLRPPESFTENSGHVKTALHNALYRMMRAKNFEEGLCHTVEAGGPTNTNAAICGALMGALLGLESIPSAWSGPLLSGPANSEGAHPRKYSPQEGMARLKALAEARETQTNNRTKSSAAGGLSLLWRRLTKKNPSSVA